MDVFVSIPDLRNLNKYFVLKNKKIYFGLTDIKGVGESVYNKILTLVEDNKLNLTEINWVQALCKILLKINLQQLKL